MEGVGNERTTSKENGDTGLSRLRLVDENISVMLQNRFHRLPSDVTISTEPMCGVQDWRLRALFCNAASI
jgi:hypothetical protein